MASIHTTVDEDKQDNGKVDFHQAATLVPPNLLDVNHIEKTKSHNNALGERVAVAEKPQSDETNPEEYPAGWSLFVMVVALVLSVFLINLDMTIVATAIPRITDEFHGLGDVSWYSSAFFMTTAGFQSAWGKVYKYFPLKTTYLTSLFIFELGSLICGVAPNSTTLIVGRAIAGVGAGGFGTGSFTIIAFAAEPKKRPMLSGILGASYGVSAVVGPLIGGALTDKATWRWCFYINLPIGGVSGLIIFFFFTTPSASKPTAASLLEKVLQMDLVGVFLIMGAVISYILALQYGGQAHPWNSPVVIGLLVGFVVIIFAFAGWEWFQEDRAMMPLRLVANRLYIVASLFEFFFAAAYFLTIYYLPIYFQSIDNSSPTESGVRNLPLILAVSISTIISGGFISKTGIAAPVMVFGAALATVTAGLMYTLDIDTPAGKWIGYQILGGVGWGLAVQIPIITVQVSAPAEDLAEVTAILFFFQTVGAAFIISAAQAAFVNVVVKTLPYSAPSVDPARLVATGATELRKVFMPEQVPGILVAYMAGLKASFLVSLASVAMALVIGLFSRWKRLNMVAVSGGVLA
ncbi:hypothetical protein SLS53_000203 [Cytospora paraplurivora]|uniref:Major facilitator superfamily (MFS) profile domain-containing protein n=1 Tax=Cytospora paraplurivora TaxID=2898453 RepID=A0AAN9UKC7_9PEZI